MAERPLVERLAEAAAQARWHARMGRTGERHPVYSPAVLVAPENDEGRDHSRPTPTQLVPHNAPAGEAKGVAAG